MTQTKDQVFGSTVLPVLQNKFFLLCIITSEGGAIKYMGITAGEEVTLRDYYT
jgi:hypothetical protein